MNLYDCFMGRNESESARPAVDPDLEFLPGEGFATFGGRDYVSEVLAEAEIRAHLSDDKLDLLLGGDLVRDVLNAGK